MSAKLTVKRNRIKAGDRVIIKDVDSNVSVHDVATLRNGQKLVVSFGFWGGRSKQYHAWDIADVTHVLTPVTDAKAKAKTEAEA